MFVFYKVVDRSCSVLRELGHIKTTHVRACTDYSGGWDAELFENLRHVSLTGQTVGGGQKERWGFEECALEELGGGFAPERAEHTQQAEVLECSLSHSRNQTSLREYGLASVGDELDGVECERHGRHFQRRAKVRDWGGLVSASLWARMLWSELILGQIQHCRDALSDCRLAHPPPSSGPT